MIDVSEVINDPDVMHAFTILRSTGSWVDGTWTPVVTTIQGFGVIEVGQPRDIDMVPEGDVIKSLRVFWSQQPIYGTHNGSNPGSSDILEWRGDQYRVLSVARWQDYGFYRAVATRLKAA